MIKRGIISETQYFFVKTVYRTATVVCSKKDKHSTNIVNLRWLQALW